MSGGPDAPRGSNRVPETRHYTFRSRPEAVSAARRALHGYEQLLDLSVFYDASLCVSELVTNAVLHADVGPDGELELDVQINGEILSVAVTDAGRGFNPQEPAPGDESGWGLYIVDRLSDRWGVERGKRTRVWFEIALGAVAEPPAPAGESPAAADARDGDRSRARRSLSPLRLRPQTRT